MNKKGNGLMTRVKLILGIVISITVLTGIVFQLDSRWAKAKEVTQLSKRLDRKIAEDRANALQERMWRLEDRYGSVDKMPPEARDEYRRLKREWEQIMALLKEKG